ncbi:MAG: NAD(P)-binding domain-containing protein, partial [Cryobacterium sp.]
MRIAVVALGKIGLPLAVQFADQGHDVVGVDVNPALVDMVNAGVEPFPGEAELQDKLSVLVPAGRLR